MLRYQRCSHAYRLNKLILRQTEADLRGFCQKRLSFSVVTLLNHQRFFAQARTVATMCHIIEKRKRIRNKIVWHLTATTLVKSNYIATKTNAFDIAIRCSAARAVSLRQPEIYHLVLQLQATDRKKQKTRGNKRERAGDVVRTPELALPHDFRFGCFI